MLYSINITPTALDDLQKGFDFYNNRVANLGFRFSDEVGNALEAVAKNPSRYPFRYQNVRAKIVAKFPYLIFYTINEVNFSVEVLRIFNTYQAPFWLKDEAI